MAGDRRAPMTVGKVVSLIRSVLAQGGSAITSTIDTATTAFILGSADTNGIRLDLSSGTLEIREGDDSAYASLNCGGLFVNAGSLNLNGATSLSGGKRTTSANTGDAALTGTAGDRVQTNEGAAGAVNLTLPAATASTGFWIHAVVQANQYLRFTAAAGDTIRDGGTVSAAAGYIRSTTVGSALNLYCINATEWIVMSKTGTWTVDS